MPKKAKVLIGIRYKQETVDFETPEYAEHFLAVYINNECAHNQKSRFKLEHLEIHSLGYAALIARMLKENRISEEGYEIYNGYSVDLFTHEKTLCRRVLPHVVKGLIRKINDNLAKPIQKSAVIND